MLELWDAFDGSVKVNNKYIGVIPSGILLSYNIQMPNIQRIRDDVKVSEIVLYQSARLKSTGHCNFLGVINVHYCKENRELYIVDGQHRYEAVRQIAQTINIPVCVELVIVDTLVELKENYNMLNKNTPLPEFPETIDKSIPEKVAVYFRERYPTAWSTGARSRRPNINFTHFQEALGVLTEHLEITSSTELQRVVEDFNRRMKSWDVGQYPDFNTLTDNIVIKCEETGMYLGLYVHKSDDYCYDWVKEILRIEKGVIVKKTKSAEKKKTPIPKKIKVDSWNVHVGNGRSEVYCICCRSNKIDTFNFHAGHVMSEANGGRVTVDNIRPICSACNLSMGSRNMDEFMKTHYPSNLAKFASSTYDNQITTIHKNVGNRWLSAFGATVERGFTRGGANKFDNL